MRQAQRLPVVVPVGVYSDDTTMVPPGPKVSDCNNVQPVDGMWENISGWLDTEITAANTCRDVYVSTDETNGQITVLADRANVLVSVALNTSLSTITPTGYGTGLNNTTNPFDIDTRTRTTSMAPFGQNVLICPSAGTISVWANNTGAAAAVIANAPDKVNYMTSTARRQVIAGGCNEAASGTYNPLCIRGSDIEDYTDWTPAATNNSFEHILPDGGMIVAMAEVNGYLIVWTLTSVWIGTFIGEVDQTYRFDRIADNAGLIGANAWTLTDQLEGPTFFWKGPDLIPRRWIFGGQPEVLSCPVRNATIKNTTVTLGSASQGPKIWAIWMKDKNQVWFFYPDSRDGTSECSRYLAYCIAESRTAQRPVWFMGKMARTGGTSSSLLARPHMLAPTSLKFYQHDVGQAKTEDNGDGADDWHIDIASIRIGEGDRVIELQGMWPDFKSQAGTISLTPYSKSTPQATEVQHTTRSLTANLSKSDFRASGRIFRLRLHGSSSTDFMRLGRPSFAIATRGKK